MYMKSLAEKLKQYGEIMETKEEGTVQLIKYKKKEYVVLCDGTVITRDEDNMFGKDEAFFPYSHQETANRISEILRRYELC